MMLFGKFNTARRVTFRFPTSRYLSTNTRSAVDVVTNSSDVSSIGTAQRLSTLSETLDSVLCTYKTKPFICTFDTKNECTGSWQTYDDFYICATSLGSRLIEKHGLEVGDRVGICTSNCEEWFIIEHACALYGFVSVSLPNTSPQNIKALVDDFSIKILFSSPLPSPPELSPSTPLLDPLEWCHPTSTGTTEASSTAVESILPPPLLPDDLLHTILLTGGSATGKPKGVKYTRGMWNADMVSYPSPSLRAVSYLPMSHIVDRHHVSVTMFNGGEVVVVDSLDSVFSALSIINPTILFITPAMCAPLLRLESVGECLRVIVCVAGALSGETAAALKHRWNVDRVVNPYGLTDVGNIALNGKLLDSVEYKILSMHDDNKEGVGEGEWACGGTASGYGRVLRGELLVKNHFEGYENQSSSEAGRSIVDGDGYFHTGDIVEVDPVRRSVVICGRVNDKVKMPNGEWVLPSQLESAVETHCSQTKDFPITDIFVETRPGSAIVCAIVHVAVDSASGSVGADTGQSITVEAATYLLNTALQHTGLAARITAVVLSPVSFTVQNQLRNHSLKLNRHQLRSYFIEELNGVFNQSTEKNLDQSSIALRVAACIASGKSGVDDKDGSDGGGGGDLSNMTFRGLGGDSLAALQVKHLLKTQHNFVDDRVVSALLNARYTLNDVRDVLRSAPPQTYDRQNFMERIASNLLAAERSPPEAPTTERVVLVTGASGIVGRHVAAELASRQQQSEGPMSLSKPLRVVCLVRKVSLADTEEMFQGLEGLEVVAGDVSLPLMGLDESAYGSLTASVQHVIHCAGNTNQSLHFEDLSSTLTATAEVLLFASHSPYLLSTTLLSTTDILAHGAPESLPLQTGEARASAELSGYANMKLFEEGIADDAACAGLAGIAVCRLGLVCNSSRPWPQKHDFIDILFRGILAVGAVPEVAVDACVPSLLPADVAAHWIVSLALHHQHHESKRTECSVFHLTNPDREKVSYQETFRDLSLPVVPYGEWLSRIPVASPLHLLLRQSSDRDSSAPLFRSSSTLADGDDDDDDHETNADPNRGTTLVTSDTMRALLRVFNVDKAAPTCVTITAPSVKNLVEKVIASARKSYNQHHK